MSDNGKRFMGSENSRANGKVRIYTLRSRWQERVRCQVRWPRHKIVRYTRQIYPIDEKA